MSRKSWCNSSQYSISDFFIDWKNVVAFIPAKKIIFYLYIAFSTMLYTYFERRCNVHAWELINLICANTLFIQCKQILKIILLSLEKEI